MRKLNQTLVRSLFIGIGTIIILGLESVLETRMEGFRPIQRLESLTFDWRVKMATRQNHSVSTNLAMVFLDDRTAEELETGTLKSHREFGPYMSGLPVPRYIHGDFLDRIHQSEPALLCYDVLFPDRRLDHPAFPIEEIVDGEKVQTLIDSDQIFARDISTSGNVILAMTDNVLPHPIFRARAVDLGHISAQPDFDGVLRRIEPRQKVRIWHEIFRQVEQLDTAKAIVGKNLIYWPDPQSESPPSPDKALFRLELNQDGQFNLQDLGVPPDYIESQFGGKAFQQPFEDREYWHMGFLMARSLLGLNLDEATELTRPNRLEIPDENGKIFRIPLDQDGKLIVHWHLKVTSPELTKASLADFFAPEVDEEFLSQWKDKVILIGSNASGNNLRDISATPLSSTDFAMMTHLNIANSIAQGSIIRTVPGFATAIIFIVAVMAASIASLKVAPPYDSLCVIILGGLYVLGAFIIFSQWNLWIPLALPVVGGLGLTHFLNLGNRAFAEQQEKSRIRRVFGQTVSPNVVNVLLKEDTSQVRGSTEVITTIFSDIRGFTDITDSLESRALSYAESLGLEGDQIDSFIEMQTRSMLEAVNENLSIQAESIKVYNGTLDKYIGDCVMAFWGAPTTDPDHALHCVQATIASHKAMLNLNVRREKENRALVTENQQRLRDGLIPIPLKPLLDMGAGINSGKAIVGLIGSTRHISNYTVFGRTVNLAARLEATSGRGRIRIGETTRDELIRALPDFENWIQSHAPTHLKGFSQAIPTFEILWWKVPESVVPTPEVPVDFSG